MSTDAMKATDNALAALTPRYRHRAERDEYAELLRQARERIWESHRPLAGWENLELVRAYLKSFNADDYFDMANDAMGDIQPDLFVQAFDDFLNGDSEQLRQLVIARLQAAVDKEIYR